MKNKKRSYFETYKFTLENSFNFKGRASRKEYWLFFLLNTLILILLIFLEVIIFPENSQVLGANIFQLLIALPTLSVGIRRIHDTNHNWLWYFFPIVNLILLLDEGTDGENKYGSKPNF